MVFLSIRSQAYIVDVCFYLGASGLSIGLTHVPHT